MEITSTPYKEEIENTVNKSKGEVKRKMQTMEVEKKKAKKSKSDWFCNLCAEDREENMIQCLKCKTWVPDLCAGVDKNTKKYVCDVCNN